MIAQMELMNSPAVVQTDPLELRVVPLRENITVSPWSLATSLHLSSLFRYNGYRTILKIYSEVLILRVSL